MKLVEKDWKAFPEIRNSRISVKVGLPFDIEEDLELNIPRVVTIMQLGGIRNLEVRSETNSVSKFRGTVSGYDGESALAGRVSSEVVPTYDFQACNNIGAEIPLKGSTWLDAKLTVHTEEVKRRLMDKKQHVGNEKLWAHEVDLAMRHGLMRLGIKHLMSISEIPSYERFYIALAYLSSIIYIDHQVTLLSPLITGTLLNFGRSLFIQKERLGGGHRGSVLLGVEADRALALGIYGLVKPVVRASGEQSK